MEIVCKMYYNDWWPSKNILYTVQFENKTITNRCITFKGNHQPGESDFSVKAVRFDNCSMTVIPDGIKERFPSMIVLLVFGAKITKLTKSDFEQFHGLKEIWFNNCDIEYIPGNLFEHLPDLEIVSFQSCRIRYIDPEALDCLHKLKVVKFNSNENIDCYFDSVSTISGIDGISLKEMKRKLRKPELCAPTGYETYDKLPKGIAADIKDYLQRDDAKDLSIKVDNGEFKVHKFILAARSKVLRKMIAGAPEAQQLTLQDIDSETFEILLKYIYDDTLPNLIKADGFKIYKRANQLGLDKLASYAIKNEVKKILPDKEIKSEFENDTKKLVEIYEAKKKMDEAIKKNIEEFESKQYFK